MHSRQLAAPSAVADPVVMTMTSMLCSLHSRRSLCVRSAAAERAGAATRFGTASSRRGCGDRRRDSLAAADRAAARVLLFVPRSRLLAVRARPSQGRDGVRARRGDQPRHDPRVGRRRARGAADGQRHASSSRTSTRRGIRQSSTVAAALRRRRCPHARGARRGLGRAARRPTISSPAPTRTSPPTCGTCRRTSAMRVLPARRASSSCHMAIALMPSSAPIGVFDSGIGGLTVVHEVIRQLPHESVVYFGDTARVPVRTEEPGHRASLQPRDRGVSHATGCQEHRHRVQHRDRARARRAARRVSTCR